MIKSLLIVNVFNGALSLNYYKNLQLADYDFIFISFILILWEGQNSMNKKMLKRSLLLSALMTAVITGNAFAADYFCGEGNSIIVGADQTTDPNTEYRVMGGFKDYTGQEFSGNVTVNGGKWDMVVGGCYVGGRTDYEMKINSTEVVIKNGTFTHVVGGTAANSVTNITSNEGRTAHLVIENGTFGDENNWNSTQFK